VTGSIPVLDIGGTHVTAALVDPLSWQLLGQPVRLALDAHGTADEILATLVRAAARLDAREGAAWGVAMPSPFDYDRGIALFEGVDKFESLHGVDVAAALRAALPRPAAIGFLNDADAFALGEYAVIGHGRLVGLTLGTGVGSGWIVDGQIVADGPGVPPEGRAHLLRIDGVALEDRMSRRAIRRAYLDATGSDADVLEICDRARAGEAVCAAVLRSALRDLGSAIGPSAVEFGADLIVVGGSMAGSWDLLEPWFREGAPDRLPPSRRSSLGEHAPLIGAARYVGAEPASRD